MSIFSYMFIFYIIVSLLTRLGNKKKRSYNLVRKEEEEDVNSFPLFAEIKEKTDLPENKFNMEQMDNLEEKDKVNNDKLVKEVYQGKYEEQGQKVLYEKSVGEVIVSEENSTERESGLEIFLSTNILVNGILLSEIIAPPRALRPYDFHRYKRYGQITR
ncbi:MAG TPA: hypothetical protein ENO17_00795 [Candidatus Atribacteria bacterium]|nr:hypothetical protein [Candidatus Atribacteria bacterium]